MFAIMILGSLFSERPFWIDDFLVENIAAWVNWSFYLASLRFATPSTERIYAGLLTSPEVRDNCVPFCGHVGGGLEKSILKEGKGDGLS